MKHQPVGAHSPPNDIGSTYYPSLGAYSSNDPVVMEQHMAWIHQMGAGVVCLSWWGRFTGDAQMRSGDEGFTDKTVPMLLDAAARHGLTVNFHLEPYPGRSASSVVEDVKYLLAEYGAHPAFHRDTLSARRLPVFYVYDSYLIPERDWAAVLKPGTRNSVRGTAHDGVFLGLIVDKAHRQSLVNAGFDGMYTYFASDGFSHGSTTARWRELADFCREHSLRLSISVGPGYDDLQVRAWNGQNVKKRNGGGYLRDMMGKALAAHPDIISLTSFNEWHEGTNFEPAVPKRIPDRTYKDYTSLGGPESYLDLTRELLDKANFGR